MAVNTLLSDAPFTASVLALASTVLDVAWTGASCERDSLLCIRVDTPSVHTTSFVARLVEAMYIKLRKPDLCVQKEHVIRVCLV